MDNGTLGYLLIGVGFLFLIGELMFPTHGILIACGIFVDVVGVLLVFYYRGRYEGFVALGAISLAMPLFAAFMFWIWPRTPMGRRMMLRLESEQTATIASLPANVELENLRGRIGKAVSLLRPSGVVEFDGRRVDCLSEGPLIDPDTWVRCIEVKPGKVIVRPIDPPRLSDLESENRS
jgi:membrane-bound serine protease (ClpP class)